MTDRKLLEQAREGYQQPQPAVPEHVIRYRIAAVTRLLGERPIDLRTGASGVKPKPVYCSDGRSWPSALEAGRDIGTSNSAISRACREGRKIRGLAFGYKEFQP